MRDTVGPTASINRRHGAFGWLVGLVVLLGVSGAAWRVGASSQSPNQAAAEAEEPVASWITAPVEFRVLSSTIVTRGEVRPEDRANVKLPVSVEGDPVLTQVVVAIGDIVGEGDRVVEVSGRPVFVFEGATPIYRSIQPGMRGDDIEGLQLALGRLGYDVDEIEIGTFGHSTKSALTEFYRAAGYEPLPTSESSEADLAVAERVASDTEAALATAKANLVRGKSAPPPSVIAEADEQVVAADRSLEAARANVITDVQIAQYGLDIARASRDTITNDATSTTDERNSANLAVTVAEVALSDARRDTASALDAAVADRNIAAMQRDELTADRPESADLQSAVDIAATSWNDAVTALDELRRVTGPTVPQGEIVFVARTPSRVLDAVSSLESSDGAVEGIPGPGEALVALASGRLVTTAIVASDQVDVLAVDVEVEILDEVSGSVYPAEISLISDIPTTGADGQSGYLVTIETIDEMPDALAGSNVRVTVTAATTESEQLVVPLAAISSGADGSTRLSVLDPTTGEPVEIPVTAGLSANGFVAVDPIDPERLTIDSLVVVGR